MRPATLGLSLSAWRRISQILCFILFLVLFIKTDYAGVDELTWAVNLLFRIDPFLAAAAMLAGKVVIVLMLRFALPYFSSLPGYSYGCQ